ncbi:MAG: galactokinase [Arachnia propionica]|nr:MAG: galactokinase [Arachnia propionica]
MSATDALLALHQEKTQTSAEGVWFAPGRVNLIGEHTDYNDGFVLPFALPQRALIAANRNQDATIRITSAQLPDAVELSLDQLEPGTPGWSSYLAGVIWALREAGYPVGGVNLTLSSDVPLGAGLSSSAAIECAVVAAMADLFDLDIAPMERVLLAQRAENDYVGAPTGLLDQSASTLCQADHGLFMDCRSHETELVPLDLASQQLELLVLDTHTPHSHVTGEYRERRDSCEQAAKLLGVPALRDIDDLAAALAELPSNLLRRRVRHVVTENQRTVTAKQLAEQGQLTELAPLLNSSHASMRDDYEITVDTVDLAVTAARANGAIGARMTGGGFGGCIIALTQLGNSDSIGTAVAAAYEQAGYLRPSWFTAAPSPGAGRLV